MWKSSQENKEGWKRAPTWSLVTSPSRDESITMDANFKIASDELKKGI